MQPQERLSVAGIARQDVQFDLTDRHRRPASTPIRPSPRPLGVTRGGERPASRLHDDEQRTEGGQDHPVALQRTAGGNSPFTNWMKKALSITTV